MTVSDKNKLKYKGNTYNFNSVAKGQIVDHYYDEKGKRNKKNVAYFGKLKQEVRKMFKSKKEKYAYVQGIKKGRRGGKPYGKKKVRKNSQKCGSSNPFGMTYEQMLREEEARKRDLL